MDISRTGFAVGLVCSCHVAKWQGTERCELLCRQASLKRVLGSKKLLLVLDLDHTLLNSTRLDEARCRLSQAFKLRRTPMW